MKDAVNCLYITMVLHDSIFFLLEGRLIGSMQWHLSSC